MFKRRKKSRDKKNEELFIRILTFFTESERYFTADMPLAEIVNEEFDECKLSMVTNSYELTLGVDITEEMVDLARLSGMTLGEFARAAARLPPVRDDLRIARFIQFTGQVIKSLLPDDDGESWKEITEPAE